MIVVFSYGQSKKNGGAASLCDLTNAFSSGGEKVVFYSVFGGLDPLVYGEHLLIGGIETKLIPKSILDFKQTKISKKGQLFLNLTSIIRPIDSIWGDVDLVVDGIGLTPEVISEFQARGVTVVRNHAGSPGAFINYFLPSKSESLDKTFDGVGKYVKIMGRYDGAIFQSYSHMAGSLELVPSLSNASAVINPTVSPSMDKYGTELSGKRMQSPLNTLRLVMVGSIQRRKGQLKLIPLVEDLKLRGYDVNAQIIGNVEEASYRDQLLNEIEENRLSADIKLIGFKSDYSSELASADALLMLSESEGVPRVIRESLCLGTPVVGYEFGDICDCIEMSNGGSFVSQDKDVSEVADALITQAALGVGKASVNARAAYEELFSRKKYTDGVLDFYKSLCS